MATRSNSWWYFDEMVPELQQYTVDWIAYALGLLKRVQEDATYLEREIRELRLSAGI